MKKNRIVILVLVFIALLSVVSIVNAVETPKVTVQNAKEFADNTDNYSAVINTPEIAGLADETVQKELNEEFSNHAAELLKQYEQSLEDLKKLPEGDKPHFTIEYKNEVLYDNADRMVFRIYDFWAAGSSNFVAQYFTADQKERRILSLGEMAGNHLDYLNVIKKHILFEMEKHNASEEMKYWVGKDAMNENWEKDMDMVFAAIEENREYYLNEKGELVITFNKYEVGPGAMGTPEFVIPADVFLK